MKDTFVQLINFRFHIFRSSASSFSPQLYCINGVVPHPYNHKLIQSGIGDRRNPNRMETKHHHSSAQKRTKGHQQLQTNQLAIKPLQTVHADHNEENVQATREPTSRTGRL